MKKSATGTILRGCQPGHVRFADADSGRMFALVLESTIPKGPCSYMGYTWALK